MRHGITLLLISLAATITRANPLHYDRIPANVSAFFHADFDAFLSSQLLHRQPAAFARVQDWHTLFGNIDDMTVYSLDPGQSAGFVILIHVHDPKLAGQLKAAVAAAPDAVVVNYQNQEIDFATIQLDQLFGHSVHGYTTTAPTPQSESHRRPKFEMGFGPGGAQLPILTPGSAYIACVGTDLIVGSFNLPSMALALDVLAGRKPSLAQQDPNNLKSDVPPGAFVQGAGLQAALTGESPLAPATQPVTDSPFASSNNPDAFNLNLFGSFDGKAKLARFDMGENQQSVYIDAACVMADTDSAEQLKNLVLGIKALVSLSKVQHGELMAPLHVESSDKTVAMQWTWPINNLPELYRRMSTVGEHENAAPPKPLQPAH